ncbi:MAG: DUF4038 domain-containing protein [Eubacteriales bacterium]|nr:DUF4038 domain-containing protein [Eubacteriales bacterium]MDD3881157.1 DUF4038 domain-containing protein [Eubacteriales bacterium]MDD4511539.1 DUF4038 domain-containing protein [Eubacteriales bacterium]
MRIAGIDAARQYVPLEIRFRGQEIGSAYESDVSAVFVSKSEEKRVSGFYDGNGEYAVRFMPSYPEEYKYEITGKSLSAPVSGSFAAKPKVEGFHGVARANGFHFAYSDGVPLRPLGTTAYAFALQPRERVEETFRSLESAPFNKIRFCVFPKHYIHNLKAPFAYPFVGSAAPESADFVWYGGETNFASLGNRFDFSAPNPAYFERLDECILRLMELGIEADLILFHPYDRWGFSNMPHETDIAYVKYAVARFSAFPNVWWSLANEYDLMPQKSVADWDDIGETIESCDAYGHLRSIHNCIPLYDFSRPWVTHCSIQRVDLYKTTELADEFRERWNKPVVFDEIAYEGDIDQGWGALTAEELVRRFWEAATRGAYATHGETFDVPSDVLWWSHGGTLHGESPARLAFLRDVLALAPACGLGAYVKKGWAETAVSDEDGSESFILVYYGFNRYSARDFHLGSGRYSVEILDTWNMTRENAGVRSGDFRLKLPAKPYIAVLLRKE